MCITTCESLGLRWVFGLCLAVLLPLLAAGCDQVVSEEARDRFQSRSGAFSVTVFPVHVVTGHQVAHDKELARRLAVFLRSSHLAKPRIASQSIAMPAYRSASETERIRLNARHLERAVKRVDLGTDYAFMAEIVCNRGETRVFGVYFYLADRFGRIASARMANKHHRQFQQIRPRSRDDGFRVLCEMIREGWIAGWGQKDVSGIFAFLSGQKLSGQKPSGE